MSPSAILMIGEFVKAALPAIVEAILGADAGHDAQQAALAKARAIAQREILDRLFDVARAEAAVKPSRGRTRIVRGQD